MFQPKRFNWTGSERRSEWTSSRQYRTVSCRTYSNVNVFQKGPLFTETNSFRTGKSQKQPIQPEIHDE